MPTQPLHPATDAACREWPLCARGHAAHGSDWLNELRPVAVAIRPAEANGRGRLRYFTYTVLMLTNSWMPNTESSRP
ncbi:MAG: hypothetical protein RL685_4638 [Pseudomonadota bacterium]|jgi:hypothetical protein